jgi:hypothetical protein
MFRRTHDRLQPDSSYRTPAGADGLSDKEYAETVQKKWERWERSGRAELHQKSALVTDELNREAADRATELTQAAAKRAGSLPAIASFFRLLVEWLEERQEQNTRRIETLSAIDPRSAIQKAADTSSRWQRLFRSKNSGRKGGRVLDGLVAAEVEVAARRLFNECVLKIGLVTLRAALGRAEQRLITTEVIRRQLEDQTHQLTSEIGVQGYVTEVVRPDEVAGMATRLAAELADEAPVLSLDDLLGAGGEDEVKALVGAAGGEARRRAVRHFEQLGSIRGLIDHFDLAFSLDAWLDEAMDVVLPGKLDLTTVGPGNAPVRALLLAPAAMEKECAERIGRSGNPLKFNYRPTTDAHEVVVRAKISGLPFSALPGKIDRDRALADFFKAAKHGHVWWVIWSHDALAKAATRSGIAEPGGPDA